MRVGLHVCSFDFPDQPRSIASTIDATVAAAEAGGVAELTFMDHWFQMEGFAPVTDPMLEGYAALGYAAARSTTLALGLLVTGVTYRHPGLLAKTVTTVDVLSGGRAQLGIGAAWYEREHRGLGVPFPPVAERFELLEETLQICLQMWSDDDGPFEGRHFQLAETLCSPAPISKPRPRIVIGGGGERKTLRLVARYTDACNLFATDPSEVAHKVDVLRRHCENESRDPASIDTTILSMGNPFDDVDAFVGSMADYAAIGVRHVSFVPIGDPVAFATRVGDDLVPRLAQLG